jgi:hypothetical protein
MSVRPVLGRVGVRTAMVLGLRLSLSPLVASGASANPTKNQDSFTNWSLNLLGAKVTSTTGKTLFLSVTVFESHYVVYVIRKQPPVVDTSASACIGLASSRGADQEAHAWLFPPIQQDLILTGSGLHTGATLDPYGTVSLTITPTKTLRRRTCGAASDVRQQVKVSGSVTFDTMSTGAKAWGDIKTTGALKFSEFATLDTLHATKPTGLACQLRPPKPPCHASVTWTVSKQRITTKDYTLFSGDLGPGLPTAVGATRSVSLPDPSG